MNKERLYLKKKVDRVEVAVAKEGFATTLTFQNLSQQACFS